MWMPILLLVLACGDFAVSADPVEAVPAVTRVRWTAEDSGVVWVEWGLDATLGRATPPVASPGPEHEVLLVGPGASTSIVYQAVLRTDEGDVLRSAPRTLTTGAGPVDLPRLVTLDGSGPASGWALTSTLGQPSYHLLLSPEGTPAWWSPAGADRVGAQQRVAPDGGSVWTNVAGLDFSEDVSALVRVGWDGAELARVAAPGGHHDFDIAADGTLGYLAIDVRRHDGHDVVGDALIELDPESGATRTVWSTWDDLPVTVTPETDTGFYPQGLDWTHANSVTWDPRDDLWLVSLRNTSQILAISREGDVVWSMGADGSREGVGLARAFTGQHSPEWTADRRLLLFDNGADGETARAVAFAVDEAAGTYTETWAYDAGGRHTTWLLGDVTELPNGNALIAWGNAGLINEVSPAGEVVWQVNTGVGHVVGFTQAVAQPGAAP